MSIGLRTFISPPLILRPHIPRSSSLPPPREATPRASPRAGAHAHALLILCVFSLLQRPGPFTAAPRPRGALASAFGSESDDEDAAGRSVDHRAAINQRIMRQGQAQMRDRKVAAAQAEALAEDPNVFDFDNVIEDIRERREAPARKDRVERPSKYIEALKEKVRRRRWIV